MWKRAGKQVADPPVDHVKEMIAIDLGESNASYERTIVISSVKLL